MRGDLLLQVCDQLFGEALVLQPDVELRMELDVFDEPVTRPQGEGCWVEQDSKNAEECEENGYVFFRARCYAPAMDTRRKPPPTSAPPEPR